MRLAPLAAPFLFVALAACGGSSATIASTSPDGSTQPGGDAGGTPDGSLPGDGGAGDDGATPGDASTSDASDSGSDAGPCNALATRKDCVTCCDTRYPGGLAAFDTAVEECACQASVCGPLDAGTPGDAGDLGTGACTGTCGTTTAPVGACERCIVGSLGTAADAGPCRSTVVSACTSSSACLRYVACTDSCPAN